MNWMAKINNPKYRNLTFSEGYNCKEMTPDELIAQIKGWREGTFGRRFLFFFNGKPYWDVREVELDENDVRVRFTFHTESPVHNILGYYWGNGNYDQKSEFIQKDSLIGYEMVDVRCGKEYMGSYWNILTK